LNYSPLNESYPKNFRILEQFIDSSSTKIRNRIDEHLKIKKKLDLGISGLTTKSVIKYIQSYRLYSLQNCDEKLNIEIANGINDLNTNGNGNY